MASGASLVCVAVRFLETLLRRPRALRDAVTLALIHKHLYEYMRETCARLDALVLELQDAATLPPPAPADA